MDKICVIVAVKHKGSFRWHWRTDADGGQCSKSYDLFYDCVAAARALGYQPKFQSDSEPIVVR